MGGRYKKKKKKSIRQLFEGLVVASMKREREITGRGIGKCVCVSVCVVDLGDQQAGRLVAAGLWD